MSSLGHKTAGSVSQNVKANLANAYNELGKELMSSKIRVVGNYTLGKVIGEGAYGKVRIGTHRLTQMRVAIKHVPKAMSASLTREIHHHRQLHHPHVTQMYEVIATESSIWIVTELCCGGELFDYLAEKGRLAEDEARVIFGQLCLAVAYLHDKGIVHRDLKLENVLLDERCRVKLGDFGFTREFERGVLMETFCGTTGYASPEMLEGRKYLGPEVDIWSLGIILYCLLTGTLPFDDDDEAVMREKIIIGEYEDPEWLSIEVRTLIRNILLKDPSQRWSISKILESPWFSSSQLRYESATASPAPADDVPPDARTSESSTSASVSESASSAKATSMPTTPDDPFASDSPLVAAPDYLTHPNTSETTIRDALSSPAVLKNTKRHPETVEEEEEQEEMAAFPVPLASSRSGSGSKAPPAFPARTPARTKRRSVSSTLSDLDQGQSASTPLLIPHTRDLDFSSLLTTPTPIIFSTSLERNLLNTLSMLGFDTAQIVHSVLSDACDSASAVWWMLKRKAEKRTLEDHDEENTPRPRRQRRNAGVQVEVGRGSAQVASAPSPPPKLAFVPPTPTNFSTPVTPPPKHRTSPLLSPVEYNGAKSSIHSTPSVSLKDRDAKGRKNRAGSVSIMQRATTALEAAGLVRKKSSEAVKEEKDRLREAERKGSVGSVRSRDSEKVAKGSSILSGSHYTEEPRSSNSSWKSKSPPMVSSKDLPSTPPPTELHHPQPLTGSPWVITGARDLPPNMRNDALAPPTPVNSPGEMRAAMSSPDIYRNTGSSRKSGSHRSRANLLAALRLWFNEDRKGKRKGDDDRLGYHHSSDGDLYQTGGALSKRRGSTRKMVARKGTRGQRASISSKRSSSVNSHRSSVASVQHMVMLESPQPVAGGRLSFGSHTPNSERGDFSSRPSSVRSFSLQQPPVRHRKSPSSSSTGSNFRTASPMKLNHRRVGSSGSTTRVVRIPSRGLHGRSNSAASSVHSPPSSRPASFYEVSDCEDFGGRTSSPLLSARKGKGRERDDGGGTPRRHGTTFVASKRSTNGYGPGTVGRSSWKKSWGLEPPGWQTRTAHLPVEVLAMSPLDGQAIRDVFSSRQSVSMGDESDWVDEDDDIPAFAGGLGQLSQSSSHHERQLHSPLETHVETVTLAPAPRGSRAMAGGRRMRSNSAGLVEGVSTRTARQKANGHSPGGRGSPLPNDSYEATGRRQLPARSGPAFRQAIQEEDEEEE